MDEKGDDLLSRATRSSEVHQQISGLAVTAQDQHTNQILIPVHGAVGSVGVDDGGVGSRGVGDCRK